MTRSDHDGADQAAGGKKCRRHMHRHSSTTPSTGTLAVEAVARGPLLRSVSRELAAYKTQSPIVVDAVCTSHQNRHAISAAPGSGVAMTLFEACIRRGDLATVTSLVANGVCANAQLGDSEGSVLPIHVACEAGNLEWGKLSIVEYLMLEQNSNIHSTSSYGFTPAGVSVAGRHNGVYEYLLSCGAVPPMRAFLDEDSRDELLLEEGGEARLTDDLAVNFGFWRRKYAIDAVLMGGSLLQWCRCLVRL